ncbi:MAG: 4-aminobutyrate--2-oxoglutarate transaminase [Oligoflexia bacterium]|nr:4-aminobutyrate--2-oxoglutarate transaminase [Oligoflexia bacterium]
MNIEIKTQIPGPKSKKLMLHREQHVARGPFHVSPVFVANAHGAVIEDVDGNKFLDFSSGIGVANTGHSHPKTIKAVKDQLEKFSHTSFNVTPYESYSLLCEKLNQKTPGHFTKKTFLANSGAEAVENAIKIARSYTKKPAIVCFDHGYHGRTYMAMGLTSKVIPYKEGFGPFPGEIYKTSFPYEYRATSKNFVETAFADFKNLVNKIDADKTAAVIIEPVLGEGGFIPAPKEFLKGISEFCAKNNIVVIADEIQTGFGRTGTLFASEQLDFTPDLITTAKGLGGGLPISAVTGRAEIMDAPMVGGIGGTYCGNPLACAAALSVFEIFEKDSILQNAQMLSQKLREKLLYFKEKFNIIGDVRGLGPMQAIELVKDLNTKEPNTDAAKALVKFGYENGVILMSAGSFGNVIRFLIPLIMTDTQLEEGLNVIEKGLAQL